MALEQDYIFVCPHCQKKATIEHLQAGAAFVAPLVKASKGRMLWGRPTLIPPVLFEYYRCSQCHRKVASNEAEVLSLVRIVRS